MSTLRLPVRIVGPDATAYPTKISDQITAATSPSVGDLVAWLLADGGSDNGVYVQFNVPKNYVGTPLLIVKGVLDGAPSSSHTLGIGFRKRAVADNETADGTFDAEEVSSVTIGSSGGGYADEDQIELSITLTGSDYAVDDQVFGYLYLDASGTSYTGNFLLMSVELQFADA